MTYLVDKYGRIIKVPEGSKLPESFEPKSSKVQTWNGRTVEFNVRDVSRRLRRE